ncbi:transcription factor E4F1 isoform X2 [Ambystoma mexicanum]|uniref:transcription factor E4F1 isoform X2 n=1 Tax=Ambystoma mexicanum TaxID=8296 RepID=UPI0037E98166
MSGAENGLTAAGGADAYLSLKAACSAAEDEDDVHKCGRCQAEFTSLDYFVQHKIQKVCQRAQEAISDSSQNATALNQEGIPSQGIPSVEESITVAHILVEASSLSEVIRNVAEFGHRPTNEGISSQEHIFEVQVENSNDGVDGQESQDDVEDETGFKMKLLLNEDGRYVCELCNKTFKTSSILKAHLVTHSSTRDFKCKMCGVAFRTKGSLIRHNRRHTDERPYTCKKCNKSFRESGALTRHLKSLTPCTEKIPFRKERILKEELPIGVSSSSTEVISALASDSIDGSPLIRLLTDAKGNVLHEVHVKMQEFPICPKSTSNEASSSEMLMPGVDNSSENLLRQAMQNSGIVIETVRLEDLRKYNDACLQMTAEELEEGEVNPKLSQCLQMEELEATDGTSENGFQNHTCPHCNEVFPVIDALRIHLQDHQGIQPHKCNSCGKEFIKWHLLKKHLGVHFSDRRYKCGECGKLYKTIAHVKGHMRVHSDDRPFSCSKCGKRYKTKSAQQVHFRTHMEDKPFACQFCSRSFREKGSLVRHTRHHTGEKPFKCYKCGRGFAEHGTLNRHLRTKSGCLLALKDAEDVLVSEENQSSDSMTEMLASEDPHTVLVEFSSVVADTQEYIIEASTHETSETSEDTEESRRKMDSHIINVVQQLVNHANSGHQIIVQNLTLARNADQVDASDTITIATPESLTEQVALTLASAIGESAVMTTKASMDTDGTLTLVASEDVDMLDQSDDFVLASNEGEVEVQTVVV